MRGPVTVPWCNNRLASQQIPCVEYESARERENDKETTLTPLPTSDQKAPSHIDDGALYVPWHAG